MIQAVEQRAVEGILTWLDRTYGEIALQPRSYYKTVLTEEPVSPWLQVQLVAFGAYPAELPDRMEWAIWRATGLAYRVRHGMVMDEEPVVVPPPRSHEEAADEAEALVNQPDPT